MENKINVAELLKGCPNGMELDCTVYDKCTLEIVFEGCLYPIQIQTPEGFMHLTKYGCFSQNTHSKCVIFPKGKTTWEGFIPPCKFKDGDIVATGNGLFIGIVEVKNNIQVKAYCAISPSGSLSINIAYRFERFATEEEKEKLFKAIKDNGFHWNAETKTLEDLIEPKFKVGDRIKSVISSSYYTVVDIKNDNYFIKSDTEKYPYQISFENEINYKLVPNQFDINTLVPFDKVLTRQTSGQIWTANLFSHKIDNNKKLSMTFVCLGGYCPTMCIPYEGNEHLLGTSKDCDEYFKTWEN